MNGEVCPNGVQLPLERIRKRKSHAAIVFWSLRSLCVRPGGATMNGKLDVASGTATGDPFPLMVDVGTVSVLAMADLPYSPAGILTTGGERSVNRQYVWFDRGDNKLGPAGPPGNYSDIAIHRWERKPLFNGATFK